MANKTQDDLVKEILEKMGILAAGQTAETDDVNRVTDLLPAIGPYLAAKEIAYIPDFSSIPLASFIPLVAICAYVCREKFGINGDEEAALMKAHDEGVASMLIIYRGRATYQPLQTDYI